MREPTDDPVHKKYVIQKYTAVRVRSETFLQGNIVHKSFIFLFHEFYFHFLVLISLTVHLFRNNYDDQLFRVVSFGDDELLSCCSCFVMYEIPSLVYFVSKQGKFTRKSTDLITPLFQQAAAERFISVIVGNSWTYGWRISINKNHYPHSHSIPEFISWRFTSYIHSRNLHLDIAFVTH